MPQELGAFLRHLRQRRGLSMEQAGKSAQLATSTLSRWEAGHYQPRLPELELLLKAFGATSEQRENALALISRPRAVHFLRCQAEEPDLDEMRLPTSGDVIRALRHRQGLTIEQVAMAIGVHPGTVSRWEQSKATPIRELRKSLSVILQPTSDEQAVLEEPFRVLGSGWGEAVASMDTLEERLHRLRGKVDQDVPTLNDLVFLQLETEIKILCRHHDSALFLLASYYRWYSGWLSRRGRFIESGYKATLAEDIMDRCGQYDWERFSVVTLGAMAKVRRDCRREQPIAGLRMLTDYLPFVEGNTRMETALYRDMASYACDMRRSEAAIEMIGKAREAAERSEDIGAIRLADYVYADILIDLGRAAEALPFFEDLPEGDPLLYTNNLVRRARALLAIDDKSAADQSLRETYAWIDAYQFSHLQPHADFLARQL